MLIADADTDLRVLVEITDGRRRRRKCSQASDCQNRVTHVGACSGAGMMSGCEFHVRSWVARGNKRRQKRLLSGAGRGDLDRSPEGFLSS